MSAEKQDVGAPQDQLLLWTRRFSVMIHSGAALFSCLVALEEEESSGMLRGISRELRNALERGEHLSQAMAAWPEVFHEDYVASVRTGEVGGILDQTLGRLCQRMEAGLSPPPRVGDDFVSHGELAEWCWRFGHMLSAGVPVLHALGTLAEMGHPALREITRQMREEVAAGSSLALTRAELQSDKVRPAMWRHPGIFGPVLQNLLIVGVNHGLLIQTLEQAAAQLEWEARLEAQGKLPALSASAGERASPGESEGVGETHPVVCSVNDMFRRALALNAVTIDLHPEGEGKGSAVLGSEAGPLETIGLDHYDEVTRRIKIMAGMDPFTRGDGAGYVKGTIYIRHGDQQFAVTLRSMGRPRDDRLSLWIRADTDTTEL